MTASTNSRFPVDIGHLFDFPKVFLKQLEHQKIKLVAGKNPLLAFRLLALRFCLLGQDCAIETG
jgi:hypothetical protein